SLLRRSEADYDLEDSGSRGALTQAINNSAAAVVPSKCTHASLERDLQTRPGKGVQEESSRSDSQVTANQDLIDVETWGSNRVGRKYRSSGDDRESPCITLSSCQVHCAVISSAGWAPQGGLRGWVTSFCAEYVGHAPATRVYKCTARASRKPCSNFMVLVFSRTRSDYSAEGARGEVDACAAAT
ncbi:hypothetical protein DBV15_10011, partial [Temnothorax longispinosus]